jgi:signal peptidase
MLGLASMRTLARWTIRAIVCGVLVALLGVLAVGVLLPRLFGATPYVVLTSSMEPTMPPGTLVIVRHVDPASINAGDAITFQIRSGKPDVATHRVVALVRGPDGGPAFVTQGDANPNADPTIVRAAQVKGAVWYAVPELGRVATWLTPAQRSTLLGLVIGFLLLYAVTMFARSALVYRGNRRSTTLAAGDPATADGELSCAS